jgi:hypothetical protein
VAHAVDLLVDRRFLLDIGVGPRDIGLGLVVIVIGDEIFDGVVREERLELAVELGGQRLVGGEDQRRALRRLDHLGHGKGLAGAGDAEQHLGALARFASNAADALDELVDGLRLVAGGLELRLDDERHAAFRFFRPRRPVRHPGLVAELRPALLDQGGQRLHGGGDAGLRQRFDILQRDVEPGDRHEPGAGALPGGAGAAHRGAARRLQRPLARRLARGKRHAAVGHGGVAAALHPPLRPGLVLRLFSDGVGPGGNRAGKGLADRHALQGGLGRLAESVVAIFSSHAGQYGLSPAGWRGRPQAG